MYDLVRLEQAEQMLAAIASVEDAKRIVDLAEAARVYARQSKLGTSSINHATVIKLRAERRLADIVDEGQAQGQIAEQAHGGANIRNGARSASTVSTLSELGINSGRLAEARLIRDAYSDADLIELAGAADRRDVPLARYQLVRHARRGAVDGNREDPGPLPVGSFDVVLADPPWEYSNSGGLPGQAANHYPTMSSDEIRDMDIPAAENAALFLWATNPMLPEALVLAEAWGFSYKTNIVWVKQNLQKPGVGFYVRGRHELLLICTRGRMVPEQAGRAPVGSVLEADIQEHSRKPEQVYGLIESIYPGGIYLELFARRHRKGWTSWGNDRALVLAALEDDAGGG